MKNTYMNTSLKACIGYLRAFEQSMKLAAMKDDGQVDKVEEKQLKQLNKATDKYIRELEGLVDD
ncbi:MAG: hypothetical protein IJ124_15330 [Clostridia bacterium]|nr:hypothetical protein [Clostridia bacterium]